MIKLNIGCGPNIFPFDGWINYDKDDIHLNFRFFGMVAAELYNSEKEKRECKSEYIKALSFFSKEDIDIVNFIKNQGAIVYIKHDLNNKFDHADNTVDLIYVGQTIEHLNPIFEVPKFLKECYRMLKPGGIIRMTTPDLDLLIDSYINDDMDKFASEQPDFYKNMDPSSKLAMIMFGSSGDKCTWNNYEGHFFLFTKKSMTKALLVAGFKDIEYYYELGKSKSSILAHECIDKGLSHSFIVEAVK